MQNQRVLSLALQMQRSNVPGKEAGWYESIVIIKSKRKEENLIWDY